MRLVLLVVVCLATAGFAQTDTCATPSAGSETTPMPGGSSGGGGKKGGGKRSNGGRAGGIVSNNSGGPTPTTMGSSKVQMGGSGVVRTAPLSKSNR